MRAYPVELLIESVPEDTEHLDALLLQLHPLTPKVIEKIVSIATIEPGKPKEIELTRARAAAALRLFLLSPKACRDEVFFEQLSSAHHHRDHQTQVVVHVIPTDLGALPSLSHLKLLPEDRDALSLQRSPAAAWAHIATWVRCFLTNEALPGKADPGLVDPAPREEAQPLLKIGRDVINSQISVVVQHKGSKP